MSHVEELQLQDVYTLMNERHSVRSYDPTIKISREEMTEMLELSATAPSSSNLQPWRFLVIDDADLKQRLLPIANNQQQVIEASAVIAVLGDLRSFEQADAIYSKAVEGGFMTEEIKQGFVDRLQKTYGGIPPERLHLINTFDAGLITMQLMLVAKAKGYDTVPMGGYNAEKFQEAFELPETLKPILLLAIGKAAKPAHSTPRLSVDQMTYWNTFK